MARGRLLVGRSEAEQLLERHIEEGRSLFADAERVATGSDYEAWDQARGRWKNLTTAGLGTVFEDEDTVREFSLAASPAIFVGEDIERDFPYRKEALRDGIDTLVSLHERLEYMAAPEDLASEGPRPIGDLTSAKVFIVHGHDESLKERVARVLEQTGEHDVTILHEQPNQGRALIEKFEEHADEVGYAVVLLTGDDEGAVVGAYSASPRARQNVVFELGFFFGRIGRQRVAVLREAGVEKPSDIDGVVYIEVDGGGRWELELLRELRGAGLDFNVNKLV